MLEIKTIAERIENLEDFDKQVNEALAEGWELVRREIIPPYEGAMHWCPLALYAELERVIEEPDQDSGRLTAAHWIVSRNPLKPYRCSECGSCTTEPWSICPTCEAAMLQGEAK